MSQVQSVKSRPRSGGHRVTREDSSSSLEILPPEDERKNSPAAKGKGGAYKTSNSRSTEERPSSSGSLRGGSGRSGQRAPPIQRLDSASARRTPTPTKQVALQAVRRRADDNDKDFGDFSWKEHTEKEQKQLEEMKKLARKKQSVGYSELSKKLEGVNLEATNQPTASSTLDSESSSSLTSMSATEGTTGSEPEVGRGSNRENLSEATARFQQYTDKVDKKENKNDNCPVKPAGGVNIEDSDQFDTDLEESGESSEESSEEEKPKAPNELFMEFLDCMMKADYVNAQKLCEMILLYEPEHPEANKFQGLIEEKMKLEEELAQQSSSEEEESGEEDEDDDDESGSDDSDDSSESSEEEEEEAQEAAPSHTHADCCGKT